MQFINMAIVPFLISVSMLNFFDIGGLLEEIRVIFAVNVVVPHLVNILLDFEWYFIILRQWWLRRFMRTGKGGPFNQKQVNRASEGLDFDIYEFYSYVFSTVGSSLFYLPIFPLGVTFAILSMGAVY